MMLGLGFKQIIKNSLEEMPSKPSGSIWAWLALW